MASQCCSECGQVHVRFQLAVFGCLHDAGGGSSEPLEKPKLYVRQHAYYGFDTVLYVTAISRHRAQRSLNGELK